MQRRQQLHRHQLTYHNDDAQNHAGYEMFKRVALHLAAIQDQG